uniref:GSKIP domain-containing protein n=1 Tax=Graphocephala atropunctata TaxID=36148 RepID=A0A1B6LC20_9HEMI
MEEDQDWETEAVAVIKDIEAHVKVIQVSTMDPTSKGICLNVTTLEGRELCVLLGPSGFSLVGNAHDEVSVHHNDQVFYETPYSFLHSVSPSYDQSFGNLLMKKLNKLTEQK